MQWSEVTKRPSNTMLRQFAGLCLVVFGGLGAWRLWQGQSGGWTTVLLALGLGIGIVGLILPAAVRYIFTAWMIVAFPIGWLVSHVVLGILFYGLFAPVALFFRLKGRDVLHRRRAASASYWMPKPAARDVREYFRQF